MSDLENAFATWMLHSDIPGWREEYQFHPTRKWRFDFAWPAHKVAVEIEGITHFGKGIGRHQGSDGFLKDAEKYEAALQLGWKVYRVPGPWVAEGERVIWRAEVMETLRMLLEGG